MRACRALDVACITALTALAAACAESRGSVPGAAAHELVVARGDLEERFLLTGELDAVSSRSLAAPTTRMWNVTIQWMEPSGTQVKAGQRVLEFDNAELVSQLEERRLAALEAENALTRQLAEDALLVEDKAFAVTEREIELEKARLEAGVPAELMAKRDYEEKQLALERAQVALAQARDELASQRKGAELAARIKRIELDTARREIQATEAELESLVLRAPRDGLLVVADNPRERRPMQVGDMLWPGLTVLEIPDLSAMQVTATLFDVDDGRIAPGLAATCVLDAYPELELAGTVQEISPVAREPARGSLVRSYRVTIALERTDAARMRPGMSVKVLVHARSARDAIVAPRAGLELAASPPRARLEDGRELPVELDFCTAQACAIKSGLEPGMRLAASGRASPAREAAP